MKRAIVILAAAAMAATAAPALAQTSTADKNECVLASKNCTDQVDDIYQRMKKLNREIDKGTRVYTPQELARLQQKLAETQELLRKMEKPGK